MTQKATWPYLRCLRPSLREINLQCGGKIEETRTMLQAAMPAFRNASSKLESRSRCFPTPLVRKILVATNAILSGANPPKSANDETRSCEKKICNVLKINNNGGECQRKFGVFRVIARLSIAHTVGHGKNLERTSTGAFMKRDLLRNVHVFAEFSRARVNFYARTRAF